MTRLIRELRVALRANRPALLFTLAEADYRIRNKHVRLLNGRITHKENG
jgi:hypothetical protein